MKLTTLAIAIAAASLSFSAQAADLKFGGDFHVGYKSGDKKGNDYKHLEDYGTELWFKISEKSGGLTYFASAELELKSGIHGGGSTNPDEIRVGVKGNFGELIAGDMDGACDALEAGGDFNEFLAANDGLGGCSSNDPGTILYKKNIGKSTVGVSHNVETDENSVAVQYRLNKKTKFGLGYVQNKGDLDDIISASVSTKMGAFELKGRVNHGGANDSVNTAKVSENDDVEYGIFAAYNVTKRDQVNIGTDSEDTVSVGYNRKLSKNSKLFIEVADYDNELNKGTESAIGVQYKF